MFSHGFRTKALLGLFIAGGAIFSGPPALSAQTSPAQDPASEQTQVQPAALPYQLPPSPPQVSYNDGLLEVKAYNSTIADVVNAIRNATGATIEGIPASSTDRIFG